MLRIEFIDKTTKALDNKTVEIENYTCGDYMVNVYTTVYSDDGTTYRTIRVGSVKEYAPSIFHNEGISIDGTVAREYFEIQTTAYGAKEVDEIERIIAGYQQAVAVVTLLTAKFIDGREA